MQSLERRLAGPDSPWHGRRHLAHDEPAVGENVADWVLSPTRATSGCMSNDALTPPLAELTNLEAVCIPRRARRGLNDLTRYAGWLPKAM